MTIALRPESRRGLYRAGDVIWLAFDVDDPAVLAAYRRDYVAGFERAEKDKSFEFLGQISQEASKLVDEHRHAQGAGLCLGVLAELGDEWPTRLLDDWVSNENKRVLLKTFIAALKKCLYDNKKAISFLLKTVHDYYDVELSHLLYHKDAMNQFDRLRTNRSGMDTLIRAA